MKFLRQAFFALGILSLIVLVNWNVLLKSDTSVVKNAIQNRFSVLIKNRVAMSNSNEGPLQDKQHKFCKGKNSLYGTQKTEWDFRSHVSISFHST